MLASATHVSLAGKTTSTYQVMLGDYDSKESLVEVSNVGNGLGVQGTPRSNYRCQNSQLAPDTRADPSLVHPSICAYITFPIRDEFRRLTALLN